MKYTGKLAVCLLIIGVTVALVAQRIIYRAIWEFGGHRIPPPVYAIAGLVLVVAGVLIFRRRVMAGWQGILAGWIALDLAMIGWQKLFHLQGQVPLGQLEEPFSSFPGETLTWAFFGRSFPFFCLIGVLQIVGAYLLLFTRTRLFGAIFLLSVILNRYPMPVKDPLVGKLERVQEGKWRIMGVI
jgi:hypothetical protein